MKKEMYEPWYCNEISAPTVVTSRGFTYLRDGYNFDIYVQEIKPNNRSLIVRFTEPPLALRITNESQRLVTLENSEGEFENFISLVKNSNFLSWLNYESLQIYKDDPLMHFCLLVDDELIDVIISEYPKIIINA